MKNSLRRPQIPPENADLRRKVWWRTVPSITVGILSVAAFLYLEITAILNHLNEPSRILNCTLFYLLLCLAPIAIFKTWERLIDRSFEGTVLEMEFQQRSKLGLDRRVHPYTVANLKIQETDGKEGYYHYIVTGKISFGVGNRIRHYAATDFMYLLDEDKPIVCINCGNHYSATPEIHSDADEFFSDARFDWEGIRDPMAHIPDRCGYCKMSLIKRTTQKLDPFSEA